MHIILADDHAEVRSALRLLLEQEPALHIIGESIEAADLLTQVRTVSTDLVLLDWELPGLHPNDLLHQLRSYAPDVLVVALSGRPEARRLALTAGADAFVSKGDPPERLLSTLRSLVQEREKNPRGTPD